MEHGKLYIYKKTKKSKPELVIVDNGVFSVNGRVSNYWHFRKITGTGRISKEKFGDYNNADYKFEEVPEDKYETRIVLSDKLYGDLFR